ncbi:unnamed protein product [Cladocopium goreaui]|uniref:Uncharacterized tRNA/rRNA methyltransferase AF_2399 n=1 Tax=Cladocopium goreaui TaxID=2562237 RepID=A0A9P1M4L9_9DINO|nr:unnamed protein product [Cladocopium goreaui]
MRRLANSPSRSSREWARLVRDAAPVRIFTGVEELLRELDEAKVPSPSVVLLHHVRFAHNVGAALRCAQLLGAQGTVLLGGVAEQASRFEEALRISMAQRHQWRLRVAATATPATMQVLDAFKRYNYTRICVETDTAGLSSPPTSLQQANLCGAAAFVFGAEDVGVPFEVAESCDELISIPTLGKGSLNISHAVALVLYERQRQLMAADGRYTEEGIETLSRLVKRVLARMEVCLHDLSVTVTTKPCLLRGRLSSAARRVTP